MTKKEAYEMIKTALETTEMDEREELIAFVDHQMELLVKKTNSATDKRKAAAAEARTALKEQIESILTEDPMTVEAMMDYLDEGTKIGQVRYALREMAAEGTATRIEPQGRKGKVTYTK